VRLTGAGHIALVVRRRELTGFATGFWKDIESRKMSNMQWSRHCGFVAHPDEAAPCSRELSFLRDFYFLMASSIALRSIYCFRGLLSQ
jgi:hypothetical protein